MTWPSDARARSTSRTCGATALLPKLQMQIQPQRGPIWPQRENYCWVLVESYSVSSVSRDSEPSDMNSSETWRKEPAWLPGRTQKIRGGGSIPQSSLHGVWFLPSKGFRMDLVGASGPSIYYVGAQRAQRAVQLGAGSREPGSAGGEQLGSSGSAGSEVRMCTK